MKLNQFWVAMIVVAILISGYIPIPSSSVAPTGPPPANGHWWVDDNTIINDTNLEVNGNLTINNTGKLELINVTLVMNGNITIKGDELRAGMYMYTLIADGKVIDTKQMILTD